MIHFFTDPYKDELIYSAIARYHYYLGNIDYKDTLEEMFGSRTMIPSLEIGSNLDILAKNLGDKYTAEDIINKHTILPFYSPFLPKVRKEELLNSIKYEDGSGLYTKLGIIAGSICKKNDICYCPCCAKKEIEQYGEAYTHREHQLQGIFICPHDGSELKKYPINKSNSSRIEFIRLDNKLLDLRNITVIDTRHYDKLYKISKDSYYLLQAGLQNISRDKILDRYRNLLYTKGLTTSSKRIKQRELYEEFSNFYDEDFLEILESKLDNDDEYNWIRVVTRNLKRTVHPIRHILLINFLEGDIGKFFEDISDNFNPFGDGPWPCLNIAAKHYKKNIVDNLKITDDYKTRVPVGTFTCKCGFVYSRKGPDKSKQDKYKIGRIKAFGLVWQDKLKEYLKEGNYGLRELARLMKCDPKTIVKFDKLLNINYFNSDIKSTESNKRTINDDKSETYKAEILKLIKDNPTLSRTEIREKCQKQYTYLYRRHKDWLFNILPIKSRESNNAKRVDWEKRDKDVLKLVKEKYKELLDREAPIRITKSSIGKATNMLSYIEKNLDKLPKTEKYLARIIETTEDFQIRRCKKIIDSKIENEENFKLWQIQRLAGIRNEAFIEIREEVLKYIRFKNNRGKYEKSSS